MLLICHGFLQGLLPRTPKLLAPLDNRSRNGTALPVLKQHVPLKPISQSPLSTRTRLKRERLSWGSSCIDPSTTKAGSEESGSSSSHSSVDLEDEDADRDQDAYLTVSHDRMLELPKDASTTEADRTGKTALHFKVQSKISHVPLIRRSGRSRKEDLINHTSDLHNSAIALNITKECADSESSKVYDSAKNGDTLTQDKGILNNVIVFTSESKEEKNSVGNTSDPGTEIIHAVIFNANNDLNELRNVKQTEKTKYSCDEENQVDKKFVCSPVDETLNPSAAVGNVQVCTSPENIHQNDGDHKKDEKLTQEKEKRTDVNFELRTSNHTKQPFNILAHKDRSILSRNKSKSNLKYASLNTQVKDKTRKSPEQTGGREGIVTKAKSKTKSKGRSNSGTPSPRKKVIDYSQSKIIHPVTTQQHTQGRELRSAQQLRKPCVGETPRSKSAVDLITYKDMFRQIQSQSQEGPAIYEMFAGPVYEHLRVPHTCEKLNEESPPQCAPPKKTQQGHKAKHRQLKSAPSKPKRSPAETTVFSAKSKAKPVLSRIKTPTTPVRKSIHKGRNNPQLDTEVVLNKGVNICQDKGESHLSTIEETFPTYDCETIKCDDNTLTTPKSSSHGADFSHTHKNIQDTTVSSLTGNQNRPLPEPVLSQHPHRPKMDTWTSSSSNSYTITPPVYQKFLDEAGDGPLTDDLLQCLAEELISLDERDASIGPLNPNKEKSNQESSMEDDRVMGLNMFSEVTVLEVKMSNLYLPINTAG